MTKTRTIATLAALGGLTAAVALLTGLQTAKADELSDLRANQQLLQQRVDQLAQGIKAEGGVYPYGPAATSAGKGLVGGSFPRSFLIPGTDTSIRVGGEIREIFDYFISGGNPNSSPQSSTVGDNGQLLSIPLPGTSARVRSHDIFWQTPRESKMNVETRTPTAFGEARTFLEFDWAGSTAFAPGGANVTSVSDNLHPRLRFAYGTLGGWLAGQANSNFSDPDGNAQTIDFGGNVGEAGVVRIPQLRYTMPLAPWGMLGALSFSAETPETDGSTAGGQIASDGSPVSIGPFTSGGAAVPMFDPFKAAAPDLTVAWFVPQPWGHFDASAVLRPTLQINDGLGVDRTYMGWGAHAGFDVKPGWFGWSKDDILMQATGGIGIGRYLNCSCSISLVSNYPAAATAAAAGTLRATLAPAYGGEIGYKHYWAPNVWSNVNAGYFHQDLNSSLLTAGEKGSFNKELISAHANLFYSPVPFVQIGIEYMWGHRHVVSDATGNENVVIGKFGVSF